VNNRCTILFHLFWGVLNVSTWTPAAGSVPYEFNFFILVDTESPNSFTKGSKTLAPCACTIAVADNNANLDFFFHSMPPCLLNKIASKKTLLKKPERNILQQLLIQSTKL
jgi:hypothetical protein